MSDAEKGFISNANISILAQTKKKLCSLYETLISKQKKFYAKEKGKYQKATNKAITEFNKSLS